MVQAGELEGANSYLERFSSLLGSTVEHSDQLMMPLADDLKNMEAYLQLEQLRFPFTYEIKTDPELDLTLIELPPMLFQPAIENALLHGLPTAVGQPHLEITLKKQANDLLVTITDNGRPLLNTGSRNGHGKGKTLTENRVRRLNELHPAQQVHLTTTHGDSGTAVTFRFCGWA
jgi:LytS/YehU family sensor histidine kinase